MTYLNSPREPVRIRCDEDFLALVPHQLGYRPGHCAVLFVPVTSGGALCLRLSLPDGIEDHGHYAGQLNDVMAGIEHAGQASVVVYTEDVTGEGWTFAVSTAAWLGQAVEDSGLRAVGGYVVGAHEWWNLRRPDEPQPLSAVYDSQLNAHMVALGSYVQPCPPEDARAAPSDMGERSKTFLTAVDRLAGPGRCQDDARLMSPWEYLLRPSVPPSVCAEWWRHALTVVGAHPVRWVESLLSLSDLQLAELALSLSHGLLRDTLYYSWLTGDLHHLVNAHAGLRAAVENTVRPHRPGHEATVDEANMSEALRCVHVVLGQWEGAPHWQTLETAYRILHGLDDLFSWTPPDAAERPERERRRRGLHADVITARAQLEVYRGRALTARGLLKRSDEVCADRESTLTVHARLQVLDVPWWSNDPATAWPGERWWSTAGRAPAGEKYS